MIGRVLGDCQNTHLRTSIGMPLLLMLPATDAGRVLKLLYSCWSCPLLLLGAVKTLLRPVKLLLGDVKLALLEVVKLLLAVEPPLALFICMRLNPPIPLLASEVTPPLSLGCKKLMLFTWLCRVFGPTAELLERSSGVNTASRSRWLAFDSLP